MTLPTPESIESMETDLWSQILRIPSSKTATDAAFTIGQLFKEKDGGVAGCPYCGEMEMCDYDSIEIGDGNAFQEASCGNCGKCWFEVYTFSHVEER